MSYYPDPLCRPDIRCRGRGHRAGIWSSPRLDLQAGTGARHPIVGSVSSARRKLSTGGPNPANFRIADHSLGLNSIKREARAGRSIPRIALNVVSKPSSLAGEDQFGHSRQIPSNLIDWSRRLIHPVGFPQFPVRNSVRCLGSSLGESK